MQAKDAENPYRAPMGQQDDTPAIGFLAVEHNTTGYRLLRLYLRLIGGLQIIYSLVFGWFAIELLAAVIERGGTNSTDQEVFQSIVGPLLALTSAPAFFAGIGLLRNRRWALICEIAYFGAFLAMLGTVTVLEIVRSRGRLAPEPMDILLNTAPFIVPFLPVLSLRRPRSMSSAP